MKKVLLVLVMIVGIFSSCSEEEVLVVDCGCVEVQERLIIETMHKKKKLLLAMYIETLRSKEFETDYQELKLTTDDLRIFKLIKKYNYLIR